MEELQSIIDNMKACINRNSIKSDNGTYEGLTSDMLGICNFLQGFNRQNDIIAENRLLKETPEAKNYAEIFADDLYSERYDNTNNSFLKWLYDRMVCVYNESPSIDFVQRLKAIIEGDKKCK